MKSYLLLSLFCCGAVLLRAQDAHYSMYQHAPLYLNPTATGLIPTQNRLVLNYRQQWSNIPTAYRNIGVSYDKKANNGGWGLLINQNDAGAASVQQTNIYLNYALNRQLSARNVIGLGVQAGFTQKRFDASAFSFDAQYTGGSFDATASNGENFGRTSVLAPDFNVGFLYQFLGTETGKISAKAGFAFAHLNTPNISFIDGGTDDLPVRRLLHASLDYQTSPLLTLSPRFLLARHYTATELVYGVGGKYRLNETAKLHFGVDVRRNDAVIISAGLERKQWLVAASFDATNSQLQTNVNGQGAFEVAIIWQFDKAAPKPKTPEANGDRDNDGVLDAYDKCPDVAGLVRLEGCPEATNNGDLDGDGIADALDKCPDVAGVFRLEGCPDNAPPRPVTKDSDGDGLRDDVDLCPTIAGKPEFQGCNDFDKDGVYDHLDACPKIYGDPANFGCPLDNRNLDSDGDGIFDKDDRCVYLRGLPQFNGCPDTDGDGVADIEDDCPFVKGLSVNRGCPTAAPQNPQNPQNPQLPQNAAEISIDVVEFDLDKSFVRPMYLPMLNRVANIILQNPNYRILLVGHTDFEGNDAYNYQLGQRRSIAVREVLMQNGVPASRIEILSYGETMPKSSNSTDEGRQRNRRTEIRIMGN